MSAAKTCPECGGPAIPIPRHGSREPRELCGNRACPLWNSWAEEQLLIQAVCHAAHEWRHVSDDTTRGSADDEAALGGVEEKLAAAVDALTKRFPNSSALVRSVS